ncbi:MAG: hypothetical protein U5P41_07185 [Gammaproteobacteria bacterium]|nr:hypothetical protein [Gammaproteobacteria bacterium]
MNRRLIGNETGLIGYWRFDEGSGITAGDDSGSNNDGTINGATWLTDTPILDLSLGIPDILHRAGQIGSINAGNDTVTLAGSALSGHDTFAVAGAADTVDYPVSVEQGDDWIYCRGTFNTGSPNTVSLGTVLASSNSDDPVDFDEGSPVRVRCVIPGIQSELTALFEPA